LARSNANSVISFSLLYSSFSYCLFLTFFSGSIFFNLQPPVVILSLPDTLSKVSWRKNRNVGAALIRRVDIWGNSYKMRYVKLTEESEIGNSIKRDGTDHSYQRRICRPSRLHLDCFNLYSKKVVKPGGNYTTRDIG